ncbi:MAG TPA: hypothetical protein VNM48_11625, partial [Chloroflexota bacterium]|nr:hypothetical protein [Chloroflexota bacterium]
MPDQVAGGQVTLRGFNANLAPQLRADAEGKAFLVHDTNGSIDAAALDDTIDTNGVQWRHHTVGYRAMVEARSWTPEDDAILREMYESDTRRQIGERLGRTLASVRSRCLRLGLNTKAPASWTSEQVHQLCDWYAERAGLYTDIRVLAERLGRSYMAVALKANELGFGDFRRKSPLPPKPRVQSWKTKYPTLAEARAARIAAKKAWYLTHEHPRGALGMKHSDEARRKMGSASKRTADARTQAQRTAIARKGIATKMSRYGTGSPGTHAGNAYSRAKRGKRDDLGGQF